MKLSSVYKKDLFIFDFDGTIADSLGLEFEIYTRYLASLGLSIDKTAWEKLLTFHTAEGYIKFMGELFGINLDYQTFKHDYAYWARIVERERPIKPFGWFLDFLPNIRGKIIVILSNKDADLIEENLASWGVLGDVTKIYSCTTLRSTKEEILPAIIQEFNVLAQQTALFEDTQCYLDFAKTLGVTTVGVKNKSNLDRLAKADVLIDTTI